LYPDDLDVDLDEVERALAPSFLRFRIRDMSIPASPEGTAPPPETVLGAFVRHVEDQIAELESQGAPLTEPSDGASKAGSGDDTAEEIADLREVLRLGRHLLEGRQVTL
jgi:hypothetical protein